MPGVHPADLAITEAGRRLRAGRLSAIALTEAHLERIATRDRDIGAFVLVTPERALGAAGEADADFAAGVDRGPLHGIPFATKDLIDTAGVTTTYGSRRHARHVPEEDAEVVARLLAAGAVPLGKLATYEYALSGPSVDQPHPPPRNPWNTAHVSGGSSSGSAAAVAASLVRIALGTDTGGSVRSPACYCGVVGLKPTFGRLPMGGIHPLSPSLDHVGLLAATVDEARVAFEVLAANDPGAGAARVSIELAAPDVTGTPASAVAARLNGLRIAYARDWFAADPALSPDVLSGMDEAASTLTLLGASLRLVTLPDYAPLERAGATILNAEAYAVHRDALAAGQGDYGEQAWRSLLAGRALSEAELREARATSERFRNGVDADVLARHDAMLTVTTLTCAPPFTAFEGGRVRWTPMRTLPFNLTGHPALSCPIGVSDGLPFGMQLVGRAGDETTICRIGIAFERSVAPLRI